MELQNSMLGDGVLYTYFTSREFQRSYGDALLGTVASMSLGYRVCLMNR
jgi:hypothetical protein